MFETIEEMDKEIELNDIEIVLLTFKTRNSDEQNLRETDQKNLTETFPETGRVK